MKHKHIYIIGFIAVLTAFSCAKERSPHLTVNVHEVDGTPAVGADVHVWPGPGPHAGGVVNEAIMDQRGVTDASGNVSFDFEFSAVLDVDVIYYKSGVDSLLNPITDTLMGAKVIKIESKRQKEEANNFNEELDVK